MNAPQRTAAGIDSNTNNAKDQNPPTMSEVQNAPVTRNLSRHSVNEVSATFMGLHVAIDNKLTINKKKR